MSAPASAQAPNRPDAPFPISIRGALADAALSRRLASFEFDPPEVTRGAEGSALEEVFAARCRSVVLVVAVSGSGENQKVGSGTGSIVTSEGLVLTAAHVIAGAEKLAVGIFKDCRPGAQPEAFAVTIFKTDEAADLALLKIEKPPKDLAVMPMGDLASVRPGTGVVMIGHPRGLLMSMSQGVVSAIRPNYKWSTQGSAPMQATVIQTDGAINPGNSGGPMMTQAGTLIGVNSFIRGETSAGLNFAVSVDDVRAFFARRSNRSGSEAAEPARTGATPEACKAKVLKEWKEDGATMRSIDLNCSGRANAKLVLPDDPGTKAYLLWDRNGDGKADVKYYLNRKGEPEYSEWDDEFKGTFTYRAEHENGEWEPKSKLRIASR